MPAILLFGLSDYHLNIGQSTNQVIVITLPIYGLSISTLNLTLGSILELFLMDHLVWESLTSILYQRYYLTFEVSHLHLEWLLPLIFDPHKFRDGESVMMVVAKLSNSVVTIVRMIHLKAVSPIQDLVQGVNDDWSCMIIHQSYYYERHS